MKKLILTTSILLLAAACGKQAVVQPVQNQKPSEQQQTKSADETTNWKTYTNSQYGLEFKYPSNFFVLKDNKEKGISLASSESCRAILSSGGGQWPKDCRMLDLLIQKDKIVIEGQNVKKTNIEVAGFQAEKTDDQSGGMYDGMAQVYAQFKKDDYWYISSTTYNLENSLSSKGIFDQILSTFKFTPVPSGTGQAK